VSDYVNFCVNLNIPSKMIKIFANNKPWITPDIKTVINMKKTIFGECDKLKLKWIQKELDHAIACQKRIYKQKLENHFTHNDMRKVWQGMRLVSGYSNGSSKCGQLPKKANEVSLRIVWVSF
jgi:uncharacterized Fe-S cluster protein YjdI